MEKKTKLPIPTISIPMEGGEYDMLIPEGTGEVDAEIFINFSYASETDWVRAGQVGQDGRWQHRYPSGGFEFPNKNI
ncbi:hypothetical protein BK659_10790 [Pseudomonas brassicacearum]|uniref:Uncharacterized protein n=1 Tax=Pseudomonas brassicacearum TaxID=930166 RepID=A0A423H8A2_9PSED|nr:hypothetical protein [Pseudomonas brassicacearum]RON09407.1 hypothetical protein BK659_10790 [Pseudomonas brassicacearum]